MSAHTSSHTSPILLTLAHTLNPHPYTLQVTVTWGYDYTQDCLAPLLNYVSKVPLLPLLAPSYNHYASPHSLPHTTTSPLTRSLIQPPR